MEWGLYLDLTIEFEDQEGCGTISSAGSLVAVKKIGGRF
jgi:hypothetical protein